MPLLSSLASALNCEPDVKQVFLFASRLNDEKDQDVISSVANVLNTEYQEDSCGAIARGVNDAIQRAMDDGSLVNASEEPAPEEPAPEEPAEFDVQHILNALSSVLNCYAEANTILAAVTTFYGRHPDIRTMEAVADMLSCDCNPNDILIKLHKIFQI